MLYNRMKTVYGSHQEMDDCKRPTSKTYEQLRTEHCDYIKLTSGKNYKR